MDVLYESTALSRHFFVTAFCHCLLLKASGSMNDFLEFLLEYLSRKKIKANDEKHKIKAFLDCQLGTAFQNLSSTNRHRSPYNNLVPPEEIFQ